MYSVFMDHLVNFLPERWVEKSGGPLIRAIAKIYSIKSPYNIDYGNLHLSWPWGLSSGWADSIAKMNALSKLGAGLVVSKTITLHPRYGNPYPRVLRQKPLMINSMGLPNPGLKYWVTHLNQIDNIPQNFVFSLNGETVREWQILIRHMKKYNRILELNFSCPNVSDGVIDLESTESILKDINQHADGIEFFLKLSPQYSDEQLLDLVDLCMDNNFITGISLFNTYPVTNQALGNLRKAGGLSGPILYPRVTQILKKLRKKYPRVDQLPILAMGGISSYDQAKEIFQTYNSLPLVLTAFLMQGPFIFKDWMENYSKDNFYV